MAEYELKGISVQTAEGAELDEHDQSNLFAELTLVLTKFWKVEGVSADPPVFKLKKK